MDVVFLIYGLAFLAMGLVIVIRREHESQLELAGILWLLAAFGFTHGFLEWTDLWRIVRGNNPGLAATQPAIILISYLFLFEFGRRLVLISLSAVARARPVCRLLGAWVYAPLLGAIMACMTVSDQPALTMTIGSRYLAGFFGSSLAGVGFHLYWRNRLEPTMPAPDLRVIRIGSQVAGAAFIAYAILGGLVVPRADWFPASVINQETFLAIFRVPVQLLRASCAVLAAVSVGVLLRIFHLEGLHRLRDALQATQQALADLRKLSRQNELILRSAAEGIFGTDLDGKTVFANDAALSMLGFRREELIGNAIHPLTHHTTAAGKPYSIDDCPIQRTMQNHAMHRVSDDLFWRKDGSNFPVEYVTAPLWDEGKAIGVVVAFLDISERKRAEAHLRIAATAFESQEGMIIADVNGVILQVNRAFTEITGYTADDAVGQKMNLLRSGRHDAAFYAAMWQTIQRTGVWQGEIWNRRKNGEVYPEWLTITAVKGNDGVVTHHVSALTDITQRKAAEDEIQHLAFYDPLTRLPNRRLLLDRLQQALAASARSGREGVLLFIDLDDFKTLNDTLGHDKGDLLLQQVARRLASCVREGDTVARLGGDEFAVMLEDLSESPEEAATQAEAVGEKILATLNQTYRLAGHIHHSTPSIGVTLFADHHDTVDELLKRAELAMYQAKAAGRNTLRFFDPHMQAVVTARAALEVDLREGVQKDQFLLYYQPQVDAEGRLMGAEALVRWQHPRRGLVSPAEFIPLAEETGLILPLGHWVLETACAQLVAWAARSELAHLTLAVNMSALQFRQPDFAQQVLAVIDQTGVDPRKLKLELTESLLLDDVEDIITKMTALKARGVGFSLDDFGTGYSSLSYLKQLPLDQLKIDQSFVRDVLTDPNDAAIARTIVALAQSLGMSVIAEGVETEAQRDFLASEGCHLYQGYLFGRPGPVEEIAQFLNRG